jgi:hypothetical protein
VGRDRRHPAGLPRGMPDHPGDVKRWSVFDVPGPARHCGAQAAGMTPPAEVRGSTPRSDTTNSRQQRAKSDGNRCQVLEGPALISAEIGPIGVDLPSVSVYGVQIPSAPHQDHRRCRRMASALGDARPLHGSRSARGCPIPVLLGASWQRGRAHHLAQIRSSAGASRLARRAWVLRSSLT